ncbi:MutS-related protein [Amycolatopsis anabasis]|uniref:MutS-related protein n=1 Tax=Amycolatopsis anabasis TaxID=1840409 RepID=UPI00131E233E|nr:DNA mismatch repair protein MutS [Amycolatopsis anabasis]
MAIRSILFGSPGPPAGLESTAEPEHFRDLNLDQIEQAIVRANADCPLAPYFRHPLRDAGLVAFRQQVFRDLEDTGVRAVVERFTGSMRAMRRRLEILGRMTHPPQRQRWFLDIVLAHTETVTAFAEGLGEAALSSPGLCAVRDDLGEHTRSAEFRSLCERARRLRDRLDAVRYDMLLHEDTITIAPHDPDGDDYSARVLATFARFHQAAARDYRKDPPADLGLDKVEASVLDLVARLHPDVFAAVAAFHDEHRDFVAEDLVRLDRELRFCLGYLDFLAPLRAAGLPTCYPSVSETAKEFAAREAFDLALAASLTARGEPTVVNDVHLTGSERILLVSGPNQGGKTTLARTFGQLHHLAALGCPVPGREVRVYLPDRILTHYEREENLDTLAGKLEEELRRMRAILDRATPDSVIILNEIFTSTTLRDARALSETILGVLSELDALCLWVSFIDELSRLGGKTVSMVSTVAGDGAATRTFKLVRAPADGRAYAHAIARKHGLTYEQLRTRVSR